jgi:hypothetical protein
MPEDIRNGEKPDRDYLQDHAGEKRIDCNCVPETVTDPRIWWRIIEEDSGAGTSRRSGSVTTRRRRSASQEMRRKKTQNPREPSPIDSKQTSIAIGRRGAIQLRKKKRVPTKI